LHRHGEERGELGLVEAGVAGRARLLGLVRGCGRVQVDLPEHPAQQDLEARLHAFHVVKTELRAGGESVSGMPVPGDGGKSGSGAGWGT
jgi:hypothetical protein